jgi:hypothetical protein
MKDTLIRALFNEHFVKAGIVPVELGRLFSRMYDFRQKSDYGDFVKIQPEKVGEWFRTDRAVKDLASGPRMGGTIITVRSGVMSAVGWNKWIGNTPKKRPPLGCEGNREYVGHSIQKAHNTKVYPK